MEQWNDDSSVTSFNSRSNHGRLSAGQHISQLQQPKRLYDGLPTKKYHRYPESFKLFRALYYFWKRTGETTIALSDLGAVIRAEDTEVLKKTGIRKLTTFLDNAIQRKFPINWLHKQDGIDFGPMIELVEEAEAIYQLEVGLRAVSW